MEKIVLKVVEREDAGKEICGRIRKTGQIPGVVYKDGKVGIKLKIEKKALWQALHTSAGGNAIITLDIDRKDKPVEKTVILKDVQHDPIKDHILHVDFYEISLKEKLRVKVPVVVKGEAPGVKEEKGVLSQLEWEVEVECLPTEIPERIEVHVDKLKMNEAIHIKDLVVPAGVRLTADPEHPVVMVAPPAAEETTVAAEGETPEGEEPEVIKKGKKEEEEAAEGAEA